MKLVKIAKRSMAQFQFGDAPPITLDIIEIADEWHEINFALRVLKDDMWIIPPDKVNEFAVNRLNFVQSLVPDYKLSRIEAEEFIMMIQREAEELRNFTSPKKDETSSVPESTVTPDPTFSQ